MIPTPSNQDAPTNLASCNTEFLERHSTKVLVQETVTRRYLTVAGVWTTQPELAMTFCSGSSAVEHVTRKKLTNINLVLSRAGVVGTVIPLR